MLLRVNVDTVGAVAVGCSSARVLTGVDASALNPNTPGLFMTGKIRFRKSNRVPCSRLIKWNLDDCRFPLRHFRFRMSGLRNGPNHILDLNHHQRVLWCLISQANVACLLSASLEVHLPTVGRRALVVLWCFVLNPHRRSPYLVAYPNFLLELRVSSPVRVLLGPLGYNSPNIAQRHALP